MNLNFQNKKGMRYLYVLKLMCLFFSFSYGQVGIGTTNPNASSILELSATNKGLLLPRVNITGKNDETTIVAPAEGLVIYSPASNTNVAPGIYAYDGGSWVNLSTRKYGRLLRDLVGTQNITFTAYSSTNTYGNYLSLFDGLDNTGGGSFHSARSGTPTGDWGFGITIAKPYTISGLVFDGRNDCCTNRIVNVVVKLYRHGTLVYTSSPIIISTVGYNPVAIPDVYADEIRIVVPLGGNTGGGQGVINFSELHIMGEG